MTTQQIYVLNKVVKKLKDNLPEYQETFERFIENPQQNGLNLEKLHASGSPQSYYSIRHNDKSRVVLCPIKTAQDEQAWVVTDILPNHEYGRFKAVSFTKEEIKALTTAADEKPQVHLEVKKHPVEFVNQQFILLDDEQERIKTSSLPLIISGAPGSGKTSALLAIVKQNTLSWINASQATGNPPSILIIGKSAHLVEQMRKEWKAICDLEFPEIANQLNDIKFQTPEELYLENHPNEDIIFVGQTEFIQWYQQYAKNHNKVNKTVQLPLDAEAAALIYQEMHTMSGYASFKEYLAEVSDRFCLFTDPELRQELWTSYETYRQSLQKSVDLAFEAIELKKQYDFVGVDESQDLSRRQLRSLLQNKTEFNIKPVFCVGDHQRLFGSETTLPFLTKLFWESFNLKKAPHIKLHPTYRCALSIVKLANAGLQLKYHAVGGARALDGNELSFIQSSPKSQQGLIEWLEEPKQLDELIKNNKDNVNFAVITSPEHLEEAIALFGQERVFTAKQIKGLQNKSILLYRFFEQEEFKAANKSIPTDLVLDNNNSITKDSQGNIRHNNIFNELFVAITRTEHECRFYQPPVRNVNNITKPMKQFAVGLNANHNNSTVQTPIVSTKEEWLAQAQKLRELGQEAQAKAIEMRYAKLEQTNVVEAAQPSPAAYPDAPIAVNTRRKKKKKKAQSTPEECLESIMDELISGKVQAIEALLNFPFEELNEYQELEKKKRIIKNLPALVLMDYLKRKNLEGNPPAALLTAFNTYLRTISKWGDVKQELQDAFMAMMYYRPSNGSIPLLLLVSKMFDESVRRFVTQFKGKRLKEFFTHIQAGKLSEIPHIARLGLLDSFDDTNCTFLHLAVNLDRVDMIHELLDAGASIDKQGGENSMTALVSASSQGKEKVVIALLNRGANVNIATSVGTTPLINATIKEYRKIIEILLAAGANPNFTSQKGFTALLIAVIKNKLKIVRLLLDNGALPDYIADIYDRGNTPLYRASESGHIQILKLLIERGANVNQTWGDGFTPLRVAILENQIEAAMMLITLGADVNKGLNREPGMNPLYLTIQRGHKDLFDALIARGADVNKQLTDGSNLLHVAAENDNIEAAETLIKLKVDIDHTDKQGNTPLTTAALYGKLKFVRFLIARGVNVNTVGIGGMTPLFAAASKGHFSLVVSLSEVNNCSFRACLMSPLTLHKLARQSKNIDAIRNVDELIKAHPVDAGRIFVLPHQIAEVMGHQKIADHIKYAMKQSSTSTVTDNHLFYSETNSVPSKEDESKEKTQPPEDQMHLNSTIDFMR